VRGSEGGRRVVSPAVSGYTDPRQATDWAIYHIRRTPAQFVGLVYDAPDEHAAIAKAIDQYDVPANQRGRLIAPRRD
jgi:hypothetical protein